MGFTCWVLRHDMHGRRREISQAVRCCELEARLPMHCGHEGVRGNNGMLMFCEYLSPMER